MHGLLVAVLWPSQKREQQWLDTCKKPGKMVLLLKQEPCIGQAAVREAVLYVYIATIRAARRTG